MYVRNARNREEVWLLDHIEDMSLDDAAFRSRDYVIAVDETGNRKTGFGRIRIHRTDDGEFCELTGIGVLEGWRGQGVGAHVVERLVDRAGDEEFETVYSLTDEPEYLEQFGFERVESGELPNKLAERLDVKREGSVPEAVPTQVDVGAFTMPSELRERFKHAAEDGVEDEEPAVEETPEDFGIDSENATYKYDTG
ncbi:GNAT family N-acetyltransferase [Halococcus agarilyticus]|uniref:GNAT family N-acetyltransferase n=1 Tax=Halococcus agarilyticus TaxID=1232219 RepID=UPI0006780A00|nr:GNAT family N-acetyltransferase [Halococcus agarilyticus]